MVLDIYDDPTASVLLRRLEGPLPEKLAAAELCSSSELSVLPDRLFALVAETDQGVLRKYAMHDEPHLATSIAYFLECGKQLPRDAQVKVAANLVQACAWYDTDPPDQLVKVALMGLVGAGLNALAAKQVVKDTAAKGTAAMSNLRALQSGAAKVAGDELESWLLEEKVADVNGTDMTSVGMASKNTRAQPESKGLSQKTSEWQHCGQLRLEEPSQHKIAKAEHYALPHLQRYPLDTEAHVKKAMAYFDAWHLGFSPLERRTFAQSVCHRAEDLGVKIAGTVLDYGGDDYGPYLHGELQGRINAFEGTEKQAAYEVLLEQRDTIPPPVMVEMLKQADAELGVDGCYGRPVTGFRDPYAAVYGKVAEGNADEGFSWTHGTQYISGGTLMTFARKSRDLDHIFGAGFSKGFMMDPVKSFQKLTDPQKMVLSRIANAEASK